MRKFQSVVSRANSTVFKDKIEAINEGFEPELLWMRDLDNLLKRLSLRKSTLVAAISETPSSDSFSEQLIELELVEDRLEKASAEFGEIKADILTSIRLQQSRV